jgi:hypothetical protein
VNIGAEIRGTIERRGVPYIMVEATLTERLAIDGPAQSDRFHFKFMHAADGHGLEFDPIIVNAHFDTKVGVMRRGTGKVILKPAPHDPISQIEILEYRGATYIEGDIYAKARKLGTVAADHFLPYAFQNIDDYSGSF